MSTGATGQILIARETTWGVRPSPGVWYSVPGTDSLAETTEFLRDEVPYGGRLMPSADVGRSDFAGNIDGTNLRPDYAGLLILGALGDLVTTGTNPNYIHTFKGRRTDSSPGVALPSFTILVNRAGQWLEYKGCMIGGFSLEQDASGRCVMSTQWIARSKIRGATSAAAAVSTNVAFNFIHVLHQRNAVAYNNIQNLSLEYSNGLIIRNIQNSANQLGAAYLGRPELNVTLEFAAEDTSLFADERAVQNWLFRWQINANQTLEVTIPRLRVSPVTDQLSGLDLLSNTYTGLAEYDTVSQAEFTVVVRNQVANYNP
jgi:hypothetical protein